MLGCVVGSVADRWQDVGELSAVAHSVLERIKKFVPNGNMASVGSPKWDVCALFDALQPIGIVGFAMANQELTDKGLWFLAFTCPGPQYGYHRRLDKLAAKVEANGQVFNMRNVEFVYILSEDRDQGLLV